jgi:hypothetical protein
VPRVGSAFSTKRNGFHETKRDDATMYELRRCGSLVATQILERPRTFCENASRIQFAFSSPASQDWFASHNAHFYLLGFSYSESVLFAGSLLEHLRPRARAAGGVEAERGDR